jgi:cytoskeleton-associated protein 5
VAASNTGVGTSAREVMDSSSMRRSAASMLSGKKPVQAVPATKKSGPAKSATAKKTDGGPQSKASAAPVIEDVEPSEMSLEEIEEKLSSVVKSETISQLKSTVWKERLEGYQRCCVSCFVLFFAWFRISSDLCLFFLI